MIGDRDTHVHPAPGLTPLILSSPCVWEQGVQGRPVIPGPGHAPVYILDRSRAPSLCFLNSGYRSREVLIYTFKHLCPTDAWAVRRVG